MVDQVIDKIFIDLKDQSYSIVDGLLSIEQISNLREYVLRLYANDEMYSAKIGRGINKSENEEIRRDLIFWIDDWQQTQELANYGNFLAKFMDRSNRELFLALKRFEGHYAAYPSGSFYRRHIDQHSLTRHRQISCVLYLNPWEEGFGGELQVYPEQASTLKIAPLSGRFVCFLSAELEHEVLISNYLRLSITAWLRDDLILF